MATLSLLRSQIARARSTAPGVSARISGALTSEMTGNPATGRDTYVIGAVRRDNLETDELAVYPSAQSFL
mgnify:CR=1 FL=1